ncbi:MAG: glycosyltransferase, partial [Nitrosomonadales bacterium]|nr:glycosyltransferase [Nitrosomonadales bacterium]
MKKKLCFVVSTPMTVKAFLYEPIKKLNQAYDINVVFNLPDNESVEWLDGLAKSLPIAIERKISLYKDFKSLISLIRTFSTHQFDAVHSVTPKAGLLAMLAAFICRVPMRTHTFTGQVWATRSGFKRGFLKSFDW